MINYDPCRPSPLRCSIISLLLAVPLVSLGGCGGQGAAQSSACQDLAEESCRTDQICGSPDPCSLECERLMAPEDEVALQRCASALGAIDLPDPVAEPMANAMACASRSAKELDCLFLMTRSR